VNEPNPVVTPPTVTDWSKDAAVLVVEVDMVKSAAEVVGVDDVIPVKFAAVAAEPLTVPLIDQPPFDEPAAAGVPVPRDVMSVANCAAVSLPEVVAIVYVALAPFPSVIVRPETTAPVDAIAVPLVAVAAEALTADASALPANTFEPLKLVVVPIWLISLMID